MKYTLHRTLLVVILIFIFSFSVNAPSEQTLNTMELLEAENLILEEIREAFVDSVDNAELLTGAIDGIIKKLDPHSSFLKPERAKDFNEKLRGSFQGIGITFAIINDKITIIEAVEGGPSEAVGITSRDKIVKINGKNAVGIKEDSVKVQLRGEKGTKVNVHIERPDEEKLLKFTIVRDEIKQNSVSHSYMIDETTGYIAITRFTFKTPKDVIRALIKLKALGMRRLVIDLRGNTGGSLEAAVGVVKFFISNGLIVYTEGKRAIDNRKWEATQSRHPDYPVYTDIPLIILINHGTASASEIVSGALQDHDRALIVGQTSFGKGLVMNPFPIGNSSENKNYGTLMLSVAKYYTPSGRLIQRSYEDGKEQYYKGGFDDIDPNAADSSKTGEKFYTDLNRVVYGGGGITPDKVIDRPRKLNEYESSLRSTHVFFEFADDYLIRHNDIPTNFDDFLFNYTIPDNELERFRKYAIDYGITNGDNKPLKTEVEKVLRKHQVDDKALEKLEDTFTEADIKVNETLFDKSKDFIERGIKQEIARMIWGSEARYKVIHTNDVELINSLSFFDEATELLTKRLAIGDL